MLQRYFGLVYLSAVSQLCFRATHAECPLQISPQSVVVRYGDSVSADCKALVPHNGMGWEAKEGGVPITKDSLITWKVSMLTDWNTEPPFCYINYEKEQCMLYLPVTVFKTPDSVSISAGTQIMTEGNQYELQCDIHNVAPIQNLTVNLYKGETLMDQTSFNERTKSPVNKTTTLLIQPNRHDNGAQFRCEAELNLGEEGPQPPPKVTSDPLSIAIHYVPEHSGRTENITQNYKVFLNCTVMANPAAVYTWHSEHLKENINSSVLESSTLIPGKYTCTAKNYLGEDSKVFIVRSTGCLAELCTALVFFQLLFAFIIVI